MKPNVYALLVGVNEYKSDTPVMPQCRFNSLNACVRDAEAVAAYLQNDPYVKAHVKILTDQEATKTNVVKAFKEHLGQATATDHVLFYFSGHGVAEYTDIAIWETETDGRLECLVCHNDGSPCLLADKELRYLLHYISNFDAKGNEKVAPAHILTLFDNCHSGDNTRSAVISEEDTEAKPRQLNCVAPQRAWSDFVFSEKLSEDKVMANPTSQVLPAVPHVHLSACEAHEVAWEAKGKGIFTSTLIEQLKKADGRISYHDLIQRVRLLIGNSRYRQTPTMNMPDAAADQRELLFNGHASDTPPWTQLLHDKHKGWTIMAGLFNGLSLAQPDLKIRLQDGSPIYATMSEIGLDRAHLRVDGDAPLDKNEAYFVQLNQPLRFGGLKVFLDNQDWLASEFEEWASNLQKQASELTIVGEESKADYCLRTRYGQCYLTLPDDPFRPLFLPVEMSTVEDTLSAMLPMLQQVAQVHFLSTLSTDSESTPLRIEAFLENGQPQGEWHQTDIKKDTLNVHYHENADGKWKNALKVALTNTTDKTLYLSALYYSSDFGLYDALLNPRVYTLEAGNTMHLWQHQTNPDLVSRIPMTAQDYWIEYNWHTQSEQLQFIVSDTLFELPNVQRKGLEEPLTVDQIQRGAKRGSFDIGAEKDSDLGFSGWAVQNVLLKLHNPLHNHITASGLLTLLRDERTSAFAAGLYLSPPQDLNASHAIRPDIQIIESEEAQKSALFDFAVGIANAGARLNRNWKFKKQMRRFPDRLLAVSEGDSWFQHPLVMDVIDHLGNFYNIYSVGAAGDEYRNYLMSTEMLSAIEQVEEKYKRPVDIFLISGGGNDILGSQFVNYIRNYDEVDEKPEGQDVERLFTDRYFNEMHSLVEFYDIMLAHLAKYKPGLRVITHGYDYVIPSAPDAKKMSWLGKPMNERGIMRIGDRQGLVKYMIDRFNAAFLDLADKHDNTTHVDVRGRVHDYQWYDEIHPDKEGFQEVAMQFVKMIDA